MDGAARPRPVGPSTIGQTVEVTRRGGRLHIAHGGQLVAEHDELAGTYQMRILPEHGPGPAVRNARLRRPTAPAPPAVHEVFAVEQRDLATYDALAAAGGER